VVYKCIHLDFLHDATEWLRLARVGLDRAGWIRPRG
jgi:hypothetical protein